MPHIARAAPTLAYRHAQLGESAHTTHLDDLCYALAVLTPALKDLRAPHTQLALIFATLIIRLREFACLHLNRYHSYACK